MLIFPLEKEWYEKIKNGEKTIEYREVKPYWTKRLNKEFSFIPNKPFDDMTIGDYLHCSLCNIVCKLRLGYTNEFLTARILMIKVVDGKDTDLHIDKPVYAIHLAYVREEN